MNNPYY